jgi:hypothetical protein
MKKIELNGYNINFYSEKEWFGTGIRGNINHLYHGLVSEIPEKLAAKIVDINYNRINVNGYIASVKYGYKDYKDDNQSHASPIKSFETLSELPYCVITLNYETN